MSADFRYPANPVRLQSRRRQSVELPREGRTECVFSILFPSKAAFTGVIDRLRITGLTLLTDLRNKSTVYRDRRKNPGCEGTAPVVESALQRWIPQVSRVV